jgi:phosphatidylserine decarboxylase
VKTSRVNNRLRMPDPITFYNRYSGEIETEQIYGEKPLRWVYESCTGKLSLEMFVKRPFFSAFYGYRMSKAASRSRVAPFIANYGLDPDEFADPPDSYQSFNEFFYRKLKPDARPICASQGDIAFPADGRHLAVADLGSGDRFFVKGQKFDLPTLLGSESLAQRYAGGSLVLSRLCPVDYHRYHYCAAGTASKTHSLNGPLYSVSPIALRKNVDYLWRNKRTLTEIETPNFGTILQMEIGATNVGSINQTAKPGAISKGQEKGYFAFGGSAVITVFEAGKIRLADDLLQNSADCREVYAHMGDTMASACNNRCE